MNRERHYLQLRVPSRKEESTLIGRSVGLFCRQLGLDEVACYQMELAVVEAVHNVVDHAYESSPDGDIELNVQESDDRLIFTLVDQGRPAQIFPPGQCPVRPEDEIDSLPESRLGLYLINQVMDFIEYSVHENSNILTMVKMLDQQ